MDKYCFDCGKKLYSGNQSGRCVPCMNKHRANDPEFLKQCANTRALKKDPNYEIPKRYCIDCGQELKGHGSPLRCRSCSSKVVMKTLIAEGRAGTPCTEERKQRISEGMKAAHGRGCYDDWMPQFAELGRTVLEDPNVLEKLRASLEEYWSDPAHRLEASRRSKEYYTTNPDALEMQRKHLERLREEFWSDSDNHTKHSEFMRQLWKDPVYAKLAREHIYEVLMPAFEEWISVPENRQLKSEQAAAQLAKGFYGRQSSLELLVQDFFDTHNIAYIPQYKPDNYNRVYDFLLPDAMPPILVEVDGHYWHASDDAIARGAAETDAAKDTWANANGFDILRIPEIDMLAVGVEAFILDTRPEIVMEFF